MPRDYRKHISPLIQVSNDVKKVDSKCSESEQSVRDVPLPIFLLYHICTTPYTLKDPQ